MTVATVFSDTSDGQIQSDDAAYAVARAGGTLAANAAASSTGIGQLVPSTYRCLETFLSFDTSIIPDNATVQSVVLSLVGSFDQSDTDFVMEVRSHSWSGGGLTTTDWVAGADLGSKTLLASLNSSFYNGAAYMDFISEAAFASAVNLTGVTDVLVCSDRHRLGTTPTGNEELDVLTAENVSNKPKLTVTYGGAESLILTSSPMRW